MFELWAVLFFYAMWVSLYPDYNTRAFGHCEIFHRPPQVVCRTIYFSQSKLSQNWIWDTAINLKILLVFRFSSHFTSLHLLQVWPVDRIWPEDGGIQPTCKTAQRQSDSAKARKGSTEGHLEWKKWRTTRRPGLTGQPLDHKLGLRHVLLTDVYSTHAICTVVLWGTIKA